MNGFVVTIYYGLLLSCYIKLLDMLLSGEIYWLFGGLIFTFAVWLGVTPIMRFLDLKSPLPFLPKREHK
jgi:hypothetical protein